MRVNEILREAAQRLAPISETPRLDAEILLAHTLNISRSKLLTRLRDVAITPSFDALVARRLNHEPIAYITGTWEFFSLEFLCRAPILVPRPETEHLVEVALRHLDKYPGPVLDLCTGAGCVAIAIAKHAPGCAVTATDLNLAAVALARENAAIHNIANHQPQSVFPAKAGTQAGANPPGFPLSRERHEGASHPQRSSCNFYEGDLYDALPPNPPRFAAIVANPPYVKTSEWPGLPTVITRHEDPRALLSGEDGLDHIRRIIAGAGERLLRGADFPIGTNVTDQPDSCRLGNRHHGGLLALEIDDTQAEPVRTLLQAAGFSNIQFERDLAGHRRIAYGAYR